MITKKIHRHLERYLRRSICSFESEDYPLSFFCAATLIEEIGKIGSIGALNFASRFGLVDGGLDLTTRDAQREIRNYRSKQVAAICSTLRVNSRVSRIYREAESRFARWYRDEVFFRKRNAALYVEVGGPEVLRVPDDAISKDDAFLMICMAGECLAEAQGEMIASEHSEHQRILDVVDVFRESHKQILEKIRMEEIEYAGRANALLRAAHP